MIQQLELADAKMRESGLCQAWLSSAEATTKCVTKDCNGQLFEQLLVSSGYADAGCVVLLREGVHASGCYYDGVLLACRCDHDRRAAV